MEKIVMRGPTQADGRPGSVIEVDPSKVEKMRAKGFTLYEPAPEPTVEIDVDDAWEEDTKEK